MVGENAGQKKVRKESNYYSVPIERIKKDFPGRERVHTITDRRLEGVMEKMQTRSAIRNPCDDSSPKSHHGWVHYGKQGRRKEGRNRSEISWQWHVQPE